MPNRSAEQRMAFVPWLFVGLFASGVACLVGLIYALIAP